MSLKRGVANTTGLLLLALALFYSSRYWPQQMPLMPAATSIDSSHPDYVTTDFHAIDLDDSGRIRYELTATQLAHFSQPEHAQLVAPDMVFYRNNHSDGSAGTPPWQLTAQTGLITNGADGQRVDLSGEVNVTRMVESASETMALETSRLTVYGEREFAETDQPFVLRAAQAELSGTGMTIDMKRGQLNLQTRVRGRYDPR